MNNQDLQQFSRDIYFIGIDPACDADKCHETIVKVYGDGRLEVISQRILDTDPK